MAWIKVPPENHPLFYAALPVDPRVETQKMFGGVAALVNGNIFAGLFRRSTMLALTEADRAEALALEGAEPFDPMGNGRPRGDKVMLPEAMMEEPEELQRWLARAFEAGCVLPRKVRGVKARRAPKVSAAKAKPAVRVAKRPSKKKPSPAKKQRRKRS